MNKPKKLKEKKEKTIIYYDEYSLWNGWDAFNIPMPRIGKSKEEIELMMQQMGMVNPTMGAWDKISIQQLINAKKQEEADYMKAQTEGEKWATKWVGTFKEETKGQ